MVRPIAGLPAFVTAGRDVIPAIAAAALARITRLRLLRPAMSVTDGIMAMSETST
jgi:hypothetical protein